MSETGTGTARVAKVFRRRIKDLWNDAHGKIWWQGTEFAMPAMTDDPALPAAVLRFQMNRTFGVAFGWDGASTDEEGSVSFVHGVQPREGALSLQSLAEASIRAIASPAENDDAEDVATTGALEVNYGVQPRGLPPGPAKTLDWTQYVIPFRLIEGYQ